MPLAHLGATEGAGLSGLRAYTGLGEPGPGAVQRLDQASLPQTAVPISHVELGIAPASASPDAVDFAYGAGLTGGGFSRTIPTASLPPGSYRAWARACLGDVCGAAVARNVAL